MRRVHLVVPLLVFMLCPGEIVIGADQSPGKAGGRSPDAAARQFILGLKDRDRKAYDSAVVSSVLADNLFDFAVAAERFKKKMIEAYGEVGWRNFQDSEGANIKLAYNEMKLEEMKFETEGDTAKGVLAKGGEALYLVRKEGRWRIDLQKSFEADDDKGGMTAKSFGEALGKMAKTIRQYESKIGDDASVDQLDKEMGAEFLAILLAAGAKPTVSIKPSTSDGKED